MKKILGIVAAVMILTAATVFLPPTFTQVARIGPYYQTQMAFDSLTGGQAGGETRTYLTRSTDTLYVGDVVFVSANNTVGKSITIADYNKVAGVVVGGTNTSMRAAVTVPDTGAISDTAAFPGQRAIVMYRGRTWVIVDSAGIAPGLQIQPGTVLAGKVKAKVAILDSLNRVFGKLVDTGIVRTAVLANINVR